METEFENREDTVSHSENSMQIEDDTFFKSFAQNGSKNPFAQNIVNENAPSFFKQGLAITRRHDSFEMLTSNYRNESVLLIIHRKL